MPCSSASSPNPERVPIPPRGVDYRGKVVLAPMVRSGELPTRLLALRYGADLVWGPETVDRSIIGCVARRNPHTGVVEFVRPSGRQQQKKKQKKPKQLGEEGEGQEEEDAQAAGPSAVEDEVVVFATHPATERTRLVFQLGTSSAETAVAAARVVAPYVSGLDVNAGCPKPFSTLGGMGAALLRDPDRLCAILAALVAEFSGVTASSPDGAQQGVGVSVKIRLLETAEETAALVQRLCATGITGLTVHCRTAAMRPRERAVRGQLRMVGDICRARGVACLMNGDVADRAGAEALAAEFGVDGAMIATAAEKNPSCFRRDGAGVLAAWHEVAPLYLRAALATRNRWGNSKFLLSQLVPGRDAARRRLAAWRTYAHAVDGLADLFVGGGGGGASDPDSAAVDNSGGDAEAAAVVLPPADVEALRRLAAAVDGELGLDEAGVRGRDGERRERGGAGLKKTTVGGYGGGGKDRRKSAGSENASAMAAAGKMAEARTAESAAAPNHRKGLAERGVNVQSQANGVVPPVAAAAAAAAV